MTVQWCLGLLLGASCIMYLVVDYSCDIIYVFCILKIDDLYKILVIGFKNGPKSHWKLDVSPFKSYLIFVFLLKKNLLDRNVVIKMNMKLMVSPIETNNSNKLILC